MADPDSTSDPRTGVVEGRRVIPSTAVGWWALGLSALGLGAWIVLPMITMTFRTRYPITDTWVMPAIGLALTDLAAVVSALCVWRRRERSVLNVVAIILIIPAALFVTLVVVGEGLAGA